MDRTISSLLEDKRNLEEKLCSANDIVAKLETEIAALRPRKSLDLNPVPRVKQCLNASSHNRSLNVL